MQKPPQRRTQGIDMSRQNITLRCIVCCGEMVISPYHEMYIVECPNCGYDDKDDKDILMDRYKEKPQSEEQGLGELI